MRTMRRRISTQSFEAARRQAHIDRRELARRDSIPNHSIVTYRARSSTSIDDGACGVRCRQRRHGRANTGASCNWDDNSRYEPSKNRLSNCRPQDWLAGIVIAGAAYARRHSKPLAPTGVGRSCSEASFQGISVALQRGLRTATTPGPYIHGYCRSSWPVTFNPGQEDRDGPIRS